MVTEPSSHPQIVITALFSEPFAAASAIRALTQVGFNDADIELVGVLDGSIPNLPWLSSMGVPQEHASYYQSCFEDGGVLLFLRTAQPIWKPMALAVLAQQGGTLLPPAECPPTEMVC